MTASIENKTALAPMFGPKMQKKTENSSFSTVFAQQHTKTFFMHLMAMYPTGIIRVTVMLDVGVNVIHIGIVLKCLCVCVYCSCPAGQSFNCA